MEITWNQSRDALGQFLKKNQYRQVDDKRWTRGSFFDFHPESIPHDLLIQEETNQSIRLTVLPRNRFILGYYDTRALEKFYAHFSEGRLTAVRTFDATNISGICWFGFYELSAIFLGLFGVLLFLWTHLSTLFPDIVLDQVVRLRTYEVLAEGLGFPSFPDSSWIQKGHIDSVKPAALILAFILTFAVGFGTVMSLVISSLCPGKGFLVPWLTLFWSLILAGGSVFFKGPWSDLVTWLIGPWCALPGYFLAVALKRVHFRKKSARKKAFAVQGILGVVTFVSITFFSGVAFPQKKNSWIPEFWTPEGLITVRDEILWETDFGKWLSDEYYTHVTLSNLYLRPPLSVKWPDATVLYLGDDPQVIEYFVANHILAYSISDDEASWRTIQRGLLDTQTRQHLGPEGFEALIVDGDKAPEQFWQKLKAANPWLEKRTAIIRKNHLESPALEEQFSQLFQNKDPQNIYFLIDRFLLAVQLEHDTAKFREESFATGRILLIGVGLPLLALWAVNGLIALLAGWAYPGKRRLVSVGPFSLVFCLTVSLLLSNQGEEFDGWKEHRSRITAIYSELEALQKSLPDRIGSIEVRLKDIEHDISLYWTEDFFERARLASQSESPLIRMRLLTALDRLVRSVTTLSQIYRNYGRTYSFQKLGAWNQFQKRELVYLIEDADPGVAYWALHIAGLTNQGDERLWTAVHRQFENSHINVRDKAVLAVDESRRVESLKSLKQHYLESAGTEPGDYVRLHAYWTLLKNRALLLQK